MNDKQAKATRKKKSQNVDKDLVSIVNKSFEKSITSIKVKHYIVDIIFTILVIILAAIVILILWAIQPAVADDSISNVAIVLSVLAVSFSFIQLLMKWISTLSVNYDAYMEDIVKKNCEIISKQKEIENNLLLYALVTMKSERPDVDLEEVMEHAPELFTRSHLISRLYASES